MPISLKQTLWKKEKNSAIFIAASFLKIYILVGFLLRLVLIYKTPSSTGFSFPEIARSLLVGLLSDIGMGILLTIPLFIFYLGLNEVKYQKKVGYGLLLLLSAAVGYAHWSRSVFHQYGGGAPLIAQIFLGWKLISFALRFFIPRVRNGWRKVTLYFTWFAYIFLLLFVSVGEFFFWDEFGVRYNFIAVDYLVYTNEVIGNILESYAITPLIIVLLILSLSLLGWQARKAQLQIVRLYGLKQFALQVCAYFIICVFGYGITRYTYTLSSPNQYITQIGQNGSYDFIVAFQNNRLDYNQFYSLLPEKQCKELYADLSRIGRTNGRPSAMMPTEKLNIVLITVESLSAEYFTRYGNKENLTPHLDALMDNSLVFDSLYATGNRTVRGLEALTLCIPPSAGESIIKQENNELDGLSIGSVLSRLGYKVQYLYGGYSYFDNMEDFFSDNGYQVIDRGSIAQHNISFANIWGVCDGDIYEKSLETFDLNYQNRQPFFAHIMTTSNHRPFTYPSGTIRVDGRPNTREAAVKYTDYAIGNFLKQASAKPWFDQTVFVFIADHCASSAGMTSLPMENYHIPCLIYSPKHIRPQKFTKVCSQIDVMPTLLTMLDIPYPAESAGENVLSPGYSPRAFMATYQDLGYYENNCLTVLSPPKKVSQFSVRRLSDGTFEEKELNKLNLSLAIKAQAYYQYVNLYLKRKQKAHS